MQPITDQDRQEYLSKRIDFIDKYVKIAGNIQYYLRQIDEITRENKISLSSVFESRSVMLALNDLLNNPFIIFCPVTKFMEEWKYYACDYQGLDDDINRDKVFSNHLLNMYQNALSENGNEQLLALACYIDHKRFPSELKEVADSLSENIKSLYKEVYSAEITTLPIKPEYLYAYGLKSINPVNKLGEYGIYTPVLLYGNAPIPSSQLPNNEQIKKAQNLSGGLFGGLFYKESTKDPYEYAYGKGKN